MEWAGNRVLALRDKNASKLPARLLAKRRKMKNLDDNSAVSQTLICTQTDARRVAAMLDLDATSLAQGSALPIGWHFFLLAGETRRSSLRSDGFPGSAISLPNLGFPRLVLGGRDVQYLDSILIGASVKCDSSIKLTRKDSASGPMAIAKIQHILQSGNAPTPAIIETQTYILLGEGPRQPVPADPAKQQTVHADISKVVVLDEIALFQYSALGFNSHRIHIDRDYARNVEGYPDLVVNGGLATILLTELLRREIGAAPKVIKARHLAPLFCGHYPRRQS